MMTAEPEVPKGGAVRTQLVGGHPLWREAVFSRHLAHELDRRAPVSPALKQNVQDLAFMVDRTPEIHPLAGDPDHHLVKVPAIARPRTSWCRSPCLCSRSLGSWFRQRWILSWSRERSSRTRPARPPPSSSQASTVPSSPSPSG